MKRFSAKTSIRRPIAVLRLASLAALVGACGGDPNAGIFSWLDSGHPFVTSTG